MDALPLCGLNETAEDMRALEKVQSLIENHEGLKEAGVTFDFVEVDDPKTTLLDFYAGHKDTTCDYCIVGWENENISYAVMIGIGSISSESVMRLYNPLPGHFGDIRLQIESAHDKLMMFEELQRSKVLCYSIDKE